MEEQLYIYMSGVPSWNSDICRCIWWHPCRQ